MFCSIKTLNQNCNKQEIWANAHETRESISLISYAGCLGLSAAISAQLTLEMCVAPKIAKNSLKPPIFGV